EGVYHTADATLWFFHALGRYLEASGDWTTVSGLLPQLEEIVAHHIAGTRFGIGVDPRDGLLRQGDEALPLTWMDARVQGWVVTPRRGKAVEINALWYNALRLLEDWQRRAERGARADETARAAERARTSFNARFWNPRRSCLFDVLDGDPAEAELNRPNQLFAFTLPYPVLERERWEPVLDAVRRELLTPLGLRSLSPGAPQYKSRYDGDLRARDAAYHQGTVWSWLIGPYVDACLRVRPDDAAGARKALEAFLPHLDDACAGQVSEVFDAEPPFTPRGCVAQAWGVAELLRAWVKTEIKAAP
ncbi:MAG TPA: amylo-alpha-1,6-glucosidase, partial [Elusimicrobiota bacterium]|nr:amylo-alpha-1,6-glucosidase [Elusimicrobiota bacterium]